MEPRPCGRGNLVFFIRWRLLSLLQWSHDLAVVETRSSPRARASRQGASMEPRPCGRGNSQPTDQTADWLTLQWSHDLAVVETRGVAGHPRLLHRFNGATTLRSWKPRAPLGLVYQAFHGLTASTSPPHPACDAIGAAFPMR